MAYAGAGGYVSGVPELCPSLADVAAPDLISCGGAAARPCDTSYIKQEKEDGWRNQGRRAASSSRARPVLLPFLLGQHP